jgi:hypothetical protein
VETSGGVKPPAFVRKKKSKSVKRTTSKTTPEWIARAERAFRRVARKVRAEYQLHGLEPAVWETGKPKSRKVVDGRGLKAEVRDTSNGSAYSGAMPKALKQGKAKRRPPNLRAEVKRAMSLKAGTALVERTLRAIEAE